MVKRVFISYKYPEGIEYRERLISKLEKGSYKYLGENNKTKDISHFDDAAIGNILGRKIYSTDVTIILVSPNIRESDWIPWEISYSLREIKRQNINSSRNGMIAVVLPDRFNRYDYVFNRTFAGDSINTRNLPDIITNNMFNATDESRHHHSDTRFGSYISIYRWDEFCENMNEIINTAYTKSVNMTHLFNITTQI